MRAIALLLLSACYRDIVVPQRVVQLQHVPTRCVPYLPPAREKPLDCTTMTAFDCDLATMQWQLRQLESLTYYVETYVVAPCFGMAP